MGGTFGVLKPLPRHAKTRVYSIPPIFRGSSVEFEFDVGLTGKGHKYHQTIANGLYGPIQRRGLEHDMRP